LNSHFVLPCPLFKGFLADTLLYVVIYLLPFLRDPSHPPPPAKIPRRIPGPRRASARKLTLPRLPIRCFRKTLGRKKPSPTHAPNASENPVNHAKNSLHHERQSSQ
jgi:hypothetical protein